MTSNRRESDFWNSANTTSYFAGKQPDPRIEEFLREHPPAPHSKALDLGCGGGRHTELLAKNGYEVIGIDINQAMLETTRLRMEALALRVDLLRDSITQIPCPDESFDLVVATGVLHQAEDVVQYDQAISELARVMKMGAYVLLNVFTNKSWDESYRVVSLSGYSVVTKEGLPLTLLPRGMFVDKMLAHNLHLNADQGEDTVQESTGERSVFRGFFTKLSAE